MTFLLCSSHLPSSFQNADEMAVAEVAMLDHVLILKMEAIHTKHQDKRTRPMRTSWSSTGGSGEPLQLL